MGRSQVKYNQTHGRGRGRNAGRGRQGHLRNLGSNAYRFEEREANDVVEPSEDFGRTQFFASEQNYRETMGVSGAYFQSRTMQQWEEQGDDSVGVLDLDWIASQLELLPPSVRYRMDPKYCADIPFKPQDSGDEAAEKMKDADSMEVETASKPDAELDFLLNLSASTSTPASAPPTIASTIASTSALEKTEQLEEWLDDLLDV